MNLSIELRKRFEERVRTWRVDVDHVTETDTSIIAFGKRDKQPVVLKVIKNYGDEWRAGEILDAFDGRGMVRVYKYIEGAMLLERLSPAQSLVSMTDDDEATTALAATIKKMSPQEPMHFVPTVKVWGKGFEHYTASSDKQIPKDLLSEAHELYLNLCRSQKRVRLLHGDLHHGNVLFDDERGWLAIDPKGVVGELEYEIGAALRNPIEKPELFANASTIQKRVKRFASELNLDAMRVLSWAFTQAVLSAIWTIEDGFQIDRDYSRIALARRLWPMLDE